MNIPAVLIVRKLKTLERTIEALLGAGRGGARVTALVREYRDTINELPVETDDETLEGYENKLVDFSVRLEEIDPLVVAVQPQIVMHANNEPSKKLD